tara:strand:- start:670 stop:1002 length:333 start_codon:yes stop_codon:yes gene_type:complete
MKTDSNLLSVIGVHNFVNNSNCLEVIMYLLNKENDESIVKDFDGEETIVSGYQGGYEYRKIIKGKVTDIINHSVDILKSIAWRNNSKFVKPSQISLAFETAIDNEIRSLI